MLMMIKDDVGQALDDAADIQDVVLAVSVVLCESLSLFFVVTRVRSHSHFWHLQFVLLAVPSSLLQTTSSRSRLAPS